MKKSKFAYILVFVILLFVCSLGLGIYAQVLIHPLNKTINSPEIIDIAVNSTDDVLEMMNNLAYFKTIRNISFIAAAVLIVTIVLFIVFFVKGDVIRQKLKGSFTAKKKEKSPKPKKIPGITPPASGTPATPNTPGQKGYCRNCGKFYDSLPVYCGECGETTT